MKNKVMILGGTGYLGGILSRELKSRGYSVDCSGSSVFKAEDITDNRMIAQTVRCEGYGLLVDFTRNDTRQLMTMGFLMLELPVECTYVNVSTYNLREPGLRNDDVEYVVVKRESEKMIRPCDISVRVPWVLDSLDGIDLSDIRSDHYYWCDPKAFGIGFADIIESGKPGTFEIEARRQDIVR